MFIVNVQGICYLWWIADVLQDESLPSVNEKSRQQPPNPSRYHTVIASPEVLERRCNVNQSNYTSNEEKYLEYQFFTVGYSYKRD